MADNIIKVMIVDDHRILIDSLKSLLNNVCNISVVCGAYNGKEAVEILKHQKVDVIIMDIDLPVMNGLEATKIITEKYSNTKVLALTSFSEQAIVRKMISSGASGYILKNISKETLIEAITKVYNGEKYYSSEISLSFLKPLEKEINCNVSDASSLELLTKREIEILKLISAGFSSKEISKKLFISDKTVKVHRGNIMSKLNIHNVVGIIKFALDNGLIV